MQRWLRRSCAPIFRTMPLLMLRPLQTAYPPGVERRLQAVTIRQPSNIEE